MGEKITPATPLPWMVYDEDGQLAIFSDCPSGCDPSDHYQERVAEYWEDDGDLRFAVHACNNHHALLEALEEMVAMAEPHTYPQPDKPQSNWGKLERARAAISAAKGEAQ